MRSLPILYSWRNVLARKLSTAVTLLCVAVSVMVYVVMSATALACVYRAFQIPG